MKKEILADKELVAYCGLYCGACGRYLKGVCPGCIKNEKASWCGIRKCCKANKLIGCDECKKFENIDDCKDFNNFFSKILGFIFRSNRKACINRIKQIGREEFAKEMSEKGTHSIRRS